MTTSSWISWILVVHENVGLPCVLRFWAVNGEHLVMPVWQTISKWWDLFLVPRFVYVCMFVVQKKPHCNMSCVRPRYSFVWPVLRSRRLWTNPQWSKATERFPGHRGLVSGSWFFITSEKYHCSMPSTFIIYILTVWFKIIHRLYLYVKTRIHMYITQNFYNIKTRTYIIWWTLLSICEMTVFVSVLYIKYVIRGMALISIICCIC